MAHRLPWLVLILAAAGVVFFASDQGWLDVLQLGRAPTAADALSELELEAEAVFEAEIPELAPRLEGSAAAQAHLDAQARAAAEAAAGMQGVRTKGPGEVAFGGTVKDTSGHPAEKVKVTVLGPSGTLEGETDPMGRFDLALLPGRYKVLFEAEGLGGLVLPAYTVDGATGLEGEFTLKEKVRFTATLLREGDPVVGASVALHPKVGTGGAAQPTDSLGEAIFEDVVQDSYWFVATLPEGEEVRKSLELTKDQTLEVKVARGVRVHGVVLDLETNAPVADATVEIGVRGSSGTWILVDAKTDANGDYEVFVPKGGVARFGITVEGYAPWPTRRQLGRVLKTLQNLKRGKEVLRNAKLARGMSLEGLVTDAEDNPIQGIDLRFQARRVPTLSAVTDAEGRYAVSGIIPGRYDVVVMTGGWFSERALRVRVPKLEQDESFTFDIELLPALEVAGRVTHKRDQGAAGARVWLTGGGRLLKAASNAGRALETHTDSDGYWRITDLPPNSGVIVRASLGTLEARPRGIKTTAIPTKPLELRLGSTATFAGEVVDLRTGLPVKNAAVSVVPVGSPGGRTTRKLRTDREGRFEAYELIPGDWKVAIAHAAFLKHESKAATIQKDDEKTEVKIYLDPGLALAGVVEDQDGRPIAKADVYASGRPHGGGSWKRQSGKTDSRGYFRLTGFVRGTYTVMARKSGYRNRRIKNLVGGEQALQVSLKAR